MPSPLTVVLLPGLDGTGLLFKPLLEALPGSLAPLVIAYPPDRPLGYRELEAFVAPKLPSDREYAIVAESFSGPLAVRLAARHPPGLRALVLVASFVRNPSAPLLRPLRFLVRAPLFGFGPPRSLIRRRLVGPEAPPDLVERVVAANRLVRGAVIARRVREVLGVDVSEDLRSVWAPMLYLRAEQDRQVPAAVAAELGRLRPDMEFDSIPAPHLLLQAEPKSAARAIARFLDDCTG